MYNRVHIHKNCVTTQNIMKMHELVDLASKADDFTEQDIRDRNDRIIGSFLDYVGANGLLE